MSITKWRTGLVTLFALILCLTPSLPLCAQSAATTHNLQLSNITESVDSKGRILLTGTVKGDIQGVLTIALVVAPNGTVTGGEWALNVSFIKFGAPDKDGDGDESESLVQLGVIKGTLSGGAVGRKANGFATAVNGVDLKITGATLQYAHTTSGSGVFAGSSLDIQSASNATLSLTF